MTSTMLFNPFTGKPRDPRDIASDPAGTLVIDPDEPLIAAAPLDSYSNEDQAFYRFWYGHMQNDLMQPPLSEIPHSVARYIWDAARGGDSK